MAESFFAAVIGHPIKHSLSPALFAEFAAAAGIALEYSAVDVAPAELEGTLSHWRDDPRFIGCNVTMPHKERITQFLQRCSQAAQDCAAVNVVRHEGASLVGDNTDVAGIVATLARVGFDPKARRAVLFGAGGGARAVVTVLGELRAAEVRIVARTRERAELLAQRAATRWPKTRFEVLDLGAESPPPADLYVNATPLGMAGQPADALIPADAPRGAVGFDLVYRPARTLFLQRASAQGLRTIGGFPMLLEQALVTFERWFAFRPTLDEAALERLEALAA